MPTEPWFNFCHVCFFSDHLPDHTSEPDTMADGAQDLPACHSTGRVSQVCRQELPGAR